MNVDAIVFVFCLCAFGAFCFVLGMDAQSRRDPIVLIQPQKPAPRLVAKVTDCESVADAVIWCRAGKRLAKVGAK